MLLTKRVDISISRTTGIYYENLGYDISRVDTKWTKNAIIHGTIINVDVCHLPDGSGVLIDYQCDGCGKISKNIIWQMYKRTVRDNGETYCKSCSGKLFGGDAVRKNNLLKVDSFEKWCCDNDSEFALFRWDDKNVLLPSEISCGSSTKFLFLCPLGIHPSQENEIRVFTNGDSSLECKMCNSFGFKYSEYLFLWSDKNVADPFIVNCATHKKFWWKCPDGKHEDYERSLDSTIRFNFHCRSCSLEKTESYLQSNVRKYFDDPSYNLKHEHECSLRCINEHTMNILPYDNEVTIFEHKLIIEVQGIQHYRIQGWHKTKAKFKNTTPEQELEYIQWKDEYKKQYALSQGYYYLAIPYWTDNTDNDWKTLIDNKLEEIYYDISQQ